MNTFDHNSQLVDITPTPKILRTLGDIPFAAWQCLAELTDNSLDAFADAEYRGLLSKILELISIGPQTQYLLMSAKL